MRCFEIGMLTRESAALLVQLSLQVGWRVGLDKGLVQAEPLGAMGNGTFGRNMAFVRCDIGRDAPETPEMTGQHKKKTCARCKMSPPDSTCWTCFLDWRNFVFRRFPKRCLGHEQWALM